MYHLFIVLIMTMQAVPEETIYEFSDMSTMKNWYIIDDGVMGGLSKGHLRISEDGKGIYSGRVTTENNGGFSSLRYRLNKRSVGEYKSIALRVKGDGKLYQFRIKSDRNQRYSSVAYFETNGDWETITLPFKSFRPRFRGYPVNKPNYPGEDMAEVAFLIGNKVKEAFSLEIDKIVLVR